MRASSTTFLLLFRLKERGGTKGPKIRARERDDLAPGEKGTWQEINDVGRMRIVRWFT